MRGMIAFLFLGSLLIGLSNLAYACTCWTPRPPCEAYWQADAVFVGQVTAIKLKQDEREEDWAPVQISFAVQEALRGVTGEQLEVFTGKGGGDCGYGFRRGALYLVYAHRDPTGRLSTGICSRTQRFVEDSEDMHYVRSLAKAKSGAFIFGKVTLNPYPTRDTEQRPQPLANLQVTIAGPERRFTAITDAEGHYRLEGVPPGKYKVLIEQPPAGTLANEPTEVTLNDKGCAEVSHWLRREGGRLRGKVFDPQGHPVSKIEIFLMPLDKNSYGGDSAFTADDGSYEIKEIPPGSYRARFKHSGLVKGKRVAPAFHPATQNAEQAALIVIGEGQKLDDYPMQVPSFTAQRTIEGVVLDANGQPIPRAIVSYGIPNENLIGNVKADEQGRFSFKVYEGVKYYARVVIEKEKEKDEYYRWVEVPPWEGLKQFRLVADERME